MAFKLNISQSGKAWKMELASEVLVGKSIGEKVDGKEIGADFDGYEFEIKGGTDFAGFPMYKELAGIGLGRVLLTKGWGMKDNRKGMRLKKTVRGKIISDKVVQINMKVLKEGKKNLSEIFPEQNKIKEVVTEKEGKSKAEVKEEKKVEKAKEAVEQTAV